MSAADGRRWDQRYAQLSRPTPAEVSLPAVFAPYAAEFPSHGDALELACGRGLSSVWLAVRGMTVTGVDVSAVALAQARDLAAECGVGERCTFTEADLDGGLPAGPRANVVVCHKFRDSRLDGAIVARLAPGGLLAISALSAAGTETTPFRVRAGELEQAFAELNVLAAGVSDGTAWMLARA